MIKTVLLFLLLVPQCLWAQFKTAPDYPQGVFRDPLDIPILLAGGYGELRPGHFHEGLDIKTDGRIGFKVHAAQDGYVSRISIASTGFGHAIYITHPDGYTTVYGHLHRFFPALEQYVKQKQYQRESWAISLSFSPDLFPVKKGQFIAWSGSTGSAAGPHLHFEIRDTRTEHPLNGMLFGLRIPDHVAPTVYRIALYDRSRSIYDQDPAIYTVRRENGKYVTSAGVLKVPYGKVGFGVQALDHMNGTHNTFGIYEEVLYADGVPQTGFRLDDIGYGETRYVDAHTDYKTYKEKGEHFELLFRLPGNKLPIYHDMQGNGTVDLSDGKPHHIRIVVKDASGNASEVTVAVQEDTLHAAPPPAPCPNEMYASSRDIFENNDVQFFLEPGTLYDSLCFRYRDMPTGGKAGYYSDIFRLSSSGIPLYKSFTLQLRPDRPVADSLRGKTVIVRTDNTPGHARDVAAATWYNGWVEASFRNFGDFSVQVDDKPPVVRALNIHDGSDLSRAARISFRITDAGSGVASYRAELDGKWLMFALQGSTIYYTFDAHCPKGEHTLKLTVADQVGNETVKTYRFKR
jgi:murein DD-endopeptidase MepM/ murein hydrolase activator NlpD